MKRLRSAPAIVPLLFCAAALSFPAAAQNHPLELTVTILPPYSPLISDWEARPERVQLLVRNTDANNRYEFRLGGSIQSEDGSIRIRSKDNVDMRMFEIEAGSVKTLSGLDWNLFNQNQVEGTGVDRDLVARTGRLPEGHYTLCAWALDYNTRAQLSAPPPEGCMDLQIQFGEVPIPMTPACGEPLEVLLPQTLTFQWTTPVAGVPPEELGNLRYELLLVPVPTGKTPETAIESPGDPPFFIVRDLASALYTNTAADPLLESGTTYAWRVRVYDLNERVVFRNGGRSEVCAFTYQAVDPVCMTLQAMTPANNETIRTGLPRFSVSIDRSIRMEAVTGGRLQIFDVANNQNQTPGRTNDPNDRVLFEASFSGNSTTNIVRRSETGKADALELRFVNYPGSDYSFQPSKGKYYRWSFVLSYDPSAIRADRAVCQFSSTASDPSYFKSEATEGELPDECTADCIAAAPTPAEPGPQTLKKGDKLQIGRFTLILDNISGGTAGLSGNGEISVRFLNEIRVPVAFNGLKVNVNNQVFEGYATARADAVTSIPQSLHQLTANTSISSQADIIALCKFVQNNERFASRMWNQQAGLPLGFDNIAGGERRVICITAMEFRPTAAHLNAVMSTDLPWLGPGKSIGFIGRNICFHPLGPSNGSAKLGLDDPLPFQAVSAMDFGYEFSNNTPYFTWKWIPVQRCRTVGSIFKKWRICYTEWVRIPGYDVIEGCNAVWTCDGFSEFNARISVDFPAEAFSAASSDGTPLSRPPRIEFTGKNLRSLSDFLAESVAPIRLASKSAPGVSFMCERMIWDRSANSNASGPAGTAVPSLCETPGWTGFFAADFNLVVPPIIRFSAYDTERKPWNCAYKGLIIDANGLTAPDPEAPHIWSATGTETGMNYSLGGWGIRPESAVFRIQNNHLVSGNISGKLRLPISDRELDFTALMEKQTVDNWIFDLKNETSINNTLWGGNFDIEQARIEVKPGALSNEYGVEFASRTTFAFDGRYPVTGSIKTKFTADKLLLKNTEPYISATAWRYSGDHSWLGWDFDPQAISTENRSRAGSGSNPDTSDIVVALKIRVPLNIGCVADGRFRFRGGLFRTPDSPWTSKLLTRIREKARFNVNLSVLFQVEGEIDMFDGHGTYGDGFQGQVNANLLGLGSVAGILLVGKVNDFKYWYGDLRVISSTGKRLGTSMIYWHGLNARLWWRMRAVEEPRLEFPIDNTSISLASIGTGLDGFRYVPDRNASVGLKAIGTFAVPIDLGKWSSKIQNKWGKRAANAPKMLIADVGLGATFGNDPPFAFRQLSGNLDLYGMWFLESRNNAPLKAGGSFTTSGWKEWSGSLSMKAGLPFDRDPIAGEVGRFRLHINPGDWSMKIGEPSKPLTFSLGDFLSASGYFMMGDEALPGPPSACRPLQRNDADAVSDGIGVAFGADISVSTGKQSVGLGVGSVYGSASGSVKTDAALLYLGSACGRDPVGIRGWYATGSLALSLNASIGVEWPDIPNPIPSYCCEAGWCCKGKKWWKVCWPCCKSWCNSPPLWYGGSRTLWSGDICESASFGGPNPMWFQYVKSWTVNLLGGRINGTVSVPFHFGTRCIP